ncbi:hypothetical protein [Burkholderia pseudomallei]|uniref:hypothetical protein n=1 Tax=Burkholderia pseudomallei TaxID=28450 RepID=UPI00052A7F11|nr:hypothetical protein [Burkholderia pseudomallei]AIV62900.1 hypothetical protein X993_3355 [Burkholderia pseudomallei K42]
MKVKERRRAMKDCVFWLLWLVPWGLACDPSMFSYWNKVRGYAMGTYSPVMLWVLGLVVVMIGVNWLNYYIELGSGEIDETIDSIDWRRHGLPPGARPDLCRIFKRS